MIRVGGNVETLYVDEQLQQDVSFEYVLDDDAPQMMYVDDGRSVYVQRGDYLVNVSDGAAVLLQEGDPTVEQQYSLCDDPDGILLGDYVNENEEYYYYYEDDSANHDENVILYINEPSVVTQQAVESRSFHEEEEQSNDESNSSYRWCEPSVNDRNDDDGKEENVSVGRTLNGKRFSGKILYVGKKEERLRSGNDECIQRGPRIKMFACEVCGRTFSRNSNLSRHREIHGGGTGRQHRCHVCGCSYSFASTLTRHIVQSHIGVQGR